MYGAENQSVGAEKLKTSGMNTTMTVSEQRVGKSGSRELTTQEVKKRTERLRKESWGNSIF
jgi:hypothetical protein